MSITVKTCQLSNYCNLRYIVFITFVFFISSCGGGKQPISNRSNIASTFQTSFESVNNFQGFYIVPQDHMTSASHELSTEIVHSGSYAHKAWIYASNPESNIFQNNNHRAYPTIQLYKTAIGAFKTPVFIEFWVWLDITLSSGEWFSFATLDHTTSDSWDPVLVNLSDQGFVHLMHVPLNGQGVHTFQTTTNKFPMQQWVKLTVIIHFDKNKGYAEVLQNEQLVSRADIRRGNGLFTQAHFGLYAPPSLSKGLIYNDDLIIKELNE